MNSRAEDLTHDEIAHMLGTTSPYIVEVGANDGADTEEMFRRMPLATILCFECDPRAIAKWRERLDRVDGRAYLIEVAVSDARGYATFFQSGGSPRPDITDWDMSGSLQKPTGHLKDSPWCTFDKQIEVQTCRLDDVVSGTHKIDLCWTDTQGAERRVFAGAEKMLQRTRYVRAECHPTEQYENQWREDEMVAWFAERGFTSLGRFGLDILFRRNDQ